MNCDRYIRSRLAVLILVSLVPVIGVVLLYFFSHPLIARMLDGAMAASAITVLVIYTPKVLSKLAAPADRYFALQLGIIVSWTASGLIAIYRLLPPHWRGTQDWPPDDLLREAMVILAIVATILHIMAAAHDARRIGRGITQVFVALGLGSMIAFLIALIRGGR